MLVQNPAFPSVSLLPIGPLIDIPSATTNRICGDRVQQRNDNISTLREDTCSSTLLKSLPPAKLTTFVEIKVGELMEDAVRWVGSL